jgi:putative FmdB family regulatory protein
MDVIIFVTISLSMENFFKGEPFMPIYEFKCLKCQECFELLLMNNNEKIELKCPKCKSEDFERILSATNFSIGNPSKGNAEVSAKTRTCSSGSCSTYEIPGPTR